MRKKLSALYLSTKNMQVIEQNKASHPLKKMQVIEQKTPNHRTKKKQVID